MRNARSVHIGVHQPNNGAAILQAICDRGSNRALADSTLAGSDGYYALGRKPDLANPLRRSFVFLDANLNVVPCRQSSAQQPLSLLASFVPKQPGPSRQPKRDVNAIAFHG